MMNRIKKFFEKNNYLALKITGAILVTAIAFTAVILITTSDKGLETSVAGNDTSRNVMEATTDDTAGTETTPNLAEATSSSEEETTIVGEQSLSEESISTNDVELGDSGSTTKQDETGSKTQEKTSTKAVTTQKSTTTKQEMTKKTTTQQQTTTEKETTTQQETTTAPSRGANGVILETLTIQWLNMPHYTIPATWNQLCDDRGYDYDDEFISGVDYFSVPTKVPQDALDNGILLYNKEDGSGSTMADIIAIYGEPMYRYNIDLNGKKTKVWIYKYLSKDYGDDQNMYILFEFPESKNNIITSILAGNLENLVDEKYFIPYE